MKSTQQKNIIYSLVLLLLVLLVYLWRNREATPEQPETASTWEGKVLISGKTMGTTYRVTYLDPSERNFNEAVDSLLRDFNQSLSTYIPDSELSRFNRQDTLQFESSFFLNVLQASQGVYAQTGGAFDPTVGPLVNAWGFGPEGPQKNDSVAIRDILGQVGFDQISFDSREVRKSSPGIYLDFSAIAKGQGVDAVSDLLLAKGIRNFLVEIGGELVARGTNEKGELWKVGINRPEESAAASDMLSIVALQDRGMATSGNYRNFYRKDSLKISHTIDPKTGYPVAHSLLSATVFAPNCMLADAYATAMMVMGLEESIALDEKLQEVEVFLIYADAQGDYQTYASAGLKPYLSYVGEEGAKK